MIAALVPVKTLEAAKGRLTEILNPDERQRLALAMLEDVLRALQAVSRVERVSVVSGDEDVLAHAADLGAQPIAEPSSSRGVNQALTHASGALIDSGAQTLLVTVADLPSAAPADLEAVLDALPDHGIVVVPTEDRGTGLLALRPPGVIPFRFGDSSSVSHKREAAAARITARVLRLQSLSRDVDRPDDLAPVLADSPETATARLLTELGVAGRLGVSRPV